jgi:hypothetical protein
MYCVCVCLGSKRRRPYPASDGGPLRLHVRAEDVALAAPEAHGAAAGNEREHILIKRERERERERTHSNYLV